MKNTNKIKLNNYGTRTLILNGRNINKIIFYDKKGIIFENDGILEANTEHTRKDNSKYFWKSDLENVEIIEPIKKIKIDLSIKQNFYISSKDYLGRPSYDLYIYCNDENMPQINKIETVSENMGKGENWIYNKYELKNIDFTTTDTRQATEEEQKNGVKVWFDSFGAWTSETIKKDYAIFKKFNHIERTENQIKRRELEKEINEKFGVYSIEKAFKIYEIIKNNIEIFEKD